MPERFDIYIVYKRRYINTLPFLSFPFTQFLPHFTSFPPRPPGIPVLKLKNSPTLSEKFPLSIKLNYHSLCTTSTLNRACISYVVT